MRKINSFKNTSDSEVIELKAQQIELQSEMDKIQQEFYSFGADISRVEQELLKERKELERLKKN